jgi:hypothetical protein
MRVEPSQRPWRSGGCCVYDANGRLVADLSPACSSGHSPDQVEADTEHITSCVNHLDGFNPVAVPRLVATVKEMIRRIGAHMDGGEYSLFLETIQGRLQYSIDDLEGNSTAEILARQEAARSKSEAVL